MTVGVDFEDCPLSAALSSQIIRIKKLAINVLIQRSMFFFQLPGEVSCLSSSQGPSNVTYDECDVAKRGPLAKRLYSVEASLTVILGNWVMIVWGTTFCQAQKWRVIGRGTVGDRSIEQDKQKGPQQLRATHLWRE